MVTLFFVSWTKFFNCSRSLFNTVVDGIDDGIDLLNGFVVVVVVVVVGAVILVFMIFVLIFVIVEGLLFVDFDDYFGICIYSSRIYYYYYY